GRMACSSYAPVHRWSNPFAANTLKWLNQKSTITSSSCRGLSMARSKRACAACCKMTRARSRAALIAWGSGFAPRRACGGPYSLNSSTGSRRSVSSAANSARRFSGSAMRSGCSCASMYARAPIFRTRSMSPGAGPYASRSSTWIALPVSSTSAARAATAPATPRPSARTIIARISRRGDETSGPGGRGRPAIGGSAPVRFFTIALQVAAVMATVLAVGVQVFAVVAPTGLVCFQVRARLLGAFLVSFAHLFRQLAPVVAGFFSILFQVALVLTDFAAVLPQLLFISLDFRIGGVGRHAGNGNERDQGHCRTFIHAILPMLLMAAARPAGTQQ